MWSWRPWLASSRRRRCEPDRVRDAVNSPMTEARGIRLRGELGISRQTIAQGMPECSSCTCMLVCALFALIAHETAGAASTRHSLRPLVLGETVGKARAKRAAGMRRCVFRRYRFAPPIRAAVFGGATSSAVIVREGGRSSIPETPAVEPRGCGVLDTRLRGYDDRVWGEISEFDASRGRNDGLSFAR